MAAPKKYPPVVVVDSSDNESGSAMLADVWQKGLYHRVVAVFVLDDTGRMLLQLRGPQVGFYPNCWDQAVGGHVDENYTYEQTAVKETEEEIGIKDVELQTLGTQYLHETLSDGRIINQFERVYLLRVPHDTVLTAEPDEVAKLQWFKPAELIALLAKHPELFTPGVVVSLRKYFPEYAGVPGS